MLRRSLVAFSFFLLSGCGLPIGDQSTVEGQSFAEILVNSRSMVSDNSNDIERKIERLRSVTNFDVDVDLGSGVEQCGALSDIKVDSRKAGRGAYALKARIDIDGGYSAQMVFLGKGMDVGITTIFKDLHLANLSVYKSDQELFSGGPRSQTTFEMLKMMIVDCNIDQFLVDYSNQRGG